MSKVITKAAVEYTPNKKIFDRLEVSKYSKFNYDASNEFFSGKNPSNPNEMLFLLPKDKSVQQFLEFSFQNKVALSGYFYEGNFGENLETFLANTHSFCAKSLPYPTKRNVTIDLLDLERILLQNYRITSSGIVKHKNPNIKAPTNFTSSFVMKVVEELFPIFKAEVCIPSNQPVWAYVAERINGMEVAKPGECDSVLESLLSGLRRPRDANVQKVNFVRILEETRNCVYVGKTQLKRWNTQQILANEANLFGYKKRISLPHELTEAFNISGFKNVFVTFENIAVKPGFQSDEEILVDYLNCALTISKFDNVSVHQGFALLLSLGQMC